MEAFRRFWEVPDGYITLLPESTSGGRPKKTKTCLNLETPPEGFWTPPETPHWSKPGYVLTRTRGNYLNQEVPTERKTGTEEIRCTEPRCAHHFTETELEDFSSLSSGEVTTKKEF